MKKNNLKCFLDKRSNILKIHNPNSQIKEFLYAFCSTNLQTLAGSNSLTKAIHDPQSAKGLFLMFTEMSKNYFKGHP